MCACIWRTTQERDEYDASRKLLESEAQEARPGEDEPECDVIVATAMPSFLGLDLGETLHKQVWACKLADTRLPVARHDDGCPAHRQPAQALPLMGPRR